MKKQRFTLFAALALLSVIVIACAAPAAPAQPAATAGEIVIGSLNDLTGPTSDVGKDYALGIQEAVRWVNENGGVNGKQVRLILTDYGYKVPEYLTTYKRFRDLDKVIAMLGWGTGESAAIQPTVTADKMPFVTASYSAELADASKTPYNYYAASDYSTNARAAITVWFEEVWQKDARFAAERTAGAKPRFVAFYGKATPYASAPIKAIKEQATALGFEVGPDQDVPLTAIDTKSQVLAAKEFKPNLVWHGNTTNSVATALKDAKALGLGADHIVNNWGFDENLPRLAGDAAEGVIGIGVTAFFGDTSVKGMDNVVATAAKYNPNVPKESRLIRTVQAWANVLLLTEGLKRADKAGKLNGPGIKAELDALKDFDVGLGVPALTFSPNDHRGTSSVRVYQIKGGKIGLLKAVDMRGKYSDLWPKWIGY
ncbi:MAG: ABC transporter substrate-binding protein [Chloroflexi bacterium]|nr:ABC transporter substrate-binding protein [Chloroflexota bacterium]